MDAAIIDFRVCPPLVKCQNLMFFLISYKILIWLPLFSYAGKATKKNKKGKKVHAVFYQVGFILILYGEYNGN
jgi:hypothetical protein